MPPLETAISELRQILAEDATAPDWRWQVRRQLFEVKEALSQPQGVQPEAWLAARAQLSNRDRAQLHARVQAVSTGVLDKLDAATVRGQVKRLLSDLEHHLQRVHDLVYDSVSLELGGSE